MRQMKKQNGLLCALGRAVYRRLNGRRSCLHRLRTTAFFVHHLTLSLSRSFDNASRSLLNPSTSLSLVSPVGCNSPSLFLLWLPHCQRRRLFTSLLCSLFTSYERAFVRVYLYVCLCSLGMCFRVGAGVPSILPTDFLSVFSVSHNSNQSSAVRETSHSNGHLIFGQYLELNINLKAK